MERHRMPSEFALPDKPVSGTQQGQVVFDLACGAGWFFGGRREYH